MKKSYPGINIQWPISELILSGQKTVETRIYPIPRKYLHKQMLLIETPGKNRGFKARARAIIVFTRCFKYSSKNAFHRDHDRHLVTPHTLWDWRNKTKWGWEVEVKRTLEVPIVINQRRGILYTQEVVLGN